MTQKEFEAKLLQVVNNAVGKLQSQVPVATGQLLSSIELIATSTGYELRMNTDIAPHMVYTEEKWKHERWKGRANKNEGWFKLAAELVFRQMRAELKSSGRYIGNKE